MKSLRFNHNYHYSRYMYVIAISIIVFLGISCGKQKVIKITLEPEDPPIMYANNLEQRILAIQELSHGQPILSNQRYKILVEGDSVKILEKPLGLIGKGVALTLLSTMKAGDSRISVLVNQKLEKEFKLKVIKDMRDQDQDGYPDVIKLVNENDRQAFRDWFVQIVELQFYDQNVRWDEGNRDCSGLARFAYMESLKKHSEQWKSRWGHLLDWSIPDIKKYNYPDVPVIKQKLFRIRNGRFSTQDIEDNAFSIFATSELLMRYNSRFIGKDLSMARPGDLLFFRNNRYFHLMIYLGVPKGEKILMQKTNARKLKNTGSHYDNQEPYLVYHTGPIEKTRGEVRKVSVSTLMKHPNPKWRPIPVNPHFLGVYRWNILN